MKKCFVILLIVFTVLSQRLILAGEGMWIPLLIELLNEKEMKDMGMKISAQDIYSINHSSLKDAIVRFGRGCTAEIVSDQGLLLTNHHCGYGLIQRHSSLEHDYLTDGFWAMDKSEELPNPGLTVTFLIEIRDVTDEVLKDVNPDMTEAERDSVINSNINLIREKATEGTHYSANIKPFYHGNKYYMMINETYRDIRFVGAPPSNIGKFGGDTDNWMWPRHTGDFSVFRIYADSNNKPASYSPDNVPYKPKYHIPISIEGIEKDDFTFIFGFPGRTHEYLPSYAIELITQLRNPAKIKLRDKKIEILKDAINKNDTIRMQYSAKLAGVANYWKKMMGENRGIEKINAVDKKINLEESFQQWADADDERQKKYGRLLPVFEEIYEKVAPYELARDYVVEAGFGPEIIGFASRFSNLVEKSQIDTVTKEEINLLAEQYKQYVKNHFKNYNQQIDKEALAELFGIYGNDLDKNYLPSIFDEIEKKYNNNYEKFADKVFEKSLFASEEKLIKFLDNYKARKYKRIKKDPAYEIYSGIIDFYDSEIREPIAAGRIILDSLQRIYMKGLMEMQPDKRFYPDANSTMRVHYGKVDGYNPRDAVKYKYFTTLEGIMEKENPDIYDYVVEDKLKELYQNKDYGPYADENGTMHVCFIATNHTTGGNSGSPIMNAYGELIGINFDRCWEGTMSDLMYDPDQCRNISIDIRYLLFIIDKYAGAKHLIDEMTIVQEE